MTTHNHHDQSDADASVVEPASAPESIIDPSVSAPVTDDAPALPSVEQASPLAENAELVSPSSSVQDEPTATITDDVPALPSASEAPALASDAQTIPEDAFSLVPELLSTPETTSSAEPVQPVAQSTDALLEPPASSEQIFPATEEPSLSEATASASVEAIIATIQDDVTATKDESPSVVKDTKTIDVPADQNADLASTPSSPEIQEDANTETTFPYASILSFAEPKNDEVRPFSSFIEEFRQSEALQETYVDFSLLTPPTPDIRMPSEIFSASLPAQTQSGFSEAQTPSSDAEPTSVESPVSQAELQTTDVAARPEEKPEAEAEPAPPPHTPITRVSPLLRPASRLRMPRHSARHPREESVQEVLPAATPSVPEAPTTSPSLQQPAEQPAEPVVEQPRPARRYRFDRPAASSSTTSTTRTGTPTQSGTSPSSPQVRSEESRDKETTQSRGGASQFGSFSRQESSRQETTTPQSDQGNQPSAKTSIGANNQTQEQPAQRFAVAQEQISSESAHTTTAEPNESGRRRHHQERQQKEHQVANITPIVAPQPVAEIVMPAEITQAESVSPEDLPPLEYADLQKASPRRRRRHRSGSTTGNGASIAQGTPEAPAAQVPMLSATPAPAPAPAPAANVPDERSIAGSNSSVNPFSIVSGYTVSQMNQGNEVTGPFMGPEPSPARGSVVSRDGRTIRAEMQRSSAYPPVARTTHEGGVSSSSLNHLANVVSQSIQQSIQLQTDRMVAEMRRANQAPTSVSVSLPPFPSTERVGVFVDVANLLYSARTLRIAVDFGKLLDFLRGNRRLVRAHAYCPTSPQAGDEQMFLQAVKGLGYRITTKNYKTFSSGAKKADLDLDLCMDVVRLVDGRAVDCIVLVSGDSDFMPMLDYCSDHGVRVEVAAFDEAMSATLRQSCDLFVNLSMLEEIRS